MKTEIILMFFLLFSCVGKIFQTQVTNPECFCLQDIVVKVTDNTLHLQGAGIVIGKENSEIFILTASHITESIKNGGKIRFYNKKRFFNCSISEKASQDLGFGILVVDSKNLDINFPRYKLGYVNKTSKDYPITVIGHYDDLDWYVNKENVIKSAEFAYGDSRKFFITNKRIKMGYSGGAVFNSMGDLVGVIVEMEVGSDPRCIVVKINEVLKLLKYWKIAANFISNENLHVTNPPILRDEMILMPGGEFLMGEKKEKLHKFLRYDDIDQNEIFDEEPLHKVKIDTIYIDKYEVTNLEYARFLNIFGKDTDNNGHKMIWKYKWGIQKVENKWIAQKGYENHPVVFVSWYGANQYAEWAGKRLPSEAEWEYAAKGGENYDYSTIDGKMNPDLANYSDSRRKGTSPVDEYPPNRFGIKNMSGNVWEWCADWYDAYLGNNQTESDNRYYNKFGNYHYRVIRGGSWRSHKINLRCSERDRNDPMKGYFNVGFRCVKDLK